MKQLIFPELRQTYEWDCGAKALQSVLAYYGIEISEEILMRHTKTDPKKGTSTDQMQHALKKFSLEFDAKTMTIKDIKGYIDRGTPIMVLLQAWNGEEIDYTNDFKDGHWVVAIWYDEHRIIFEDPYAFERTFLEDSELKKRWHAKENGNKILNYGIAVFGQKGKYNPNKIIHMG